MDVFSTLTDKLTKTKTQRNKETKTKKQRHTQRHKDRQRNKETDTKKQRKKGKETKKPVRRVLHKTNAQSNYFGKPLTLRFFVLQISNWQWSSCAPVIYVKFVSENTVHIDVVLSNVADASWIRSFQVSYLLYHW